MIIKKIFLTICYVFFTYDFAVEIAHKSQSSDDLNENPYINPYYNVKLNRSVDKLGIHSYKLTEGDDYNENTRLNKTAIDSTKHHYQENIIQNRSLELFNTSIAQIKNIGSKTKNIFKKLWKGAQNFHQGSKKAWNIIIYNKDYDYSVNFHTHNLENKIIEKNYINNESLSMNIVLSKNPTADLESAGGIPLDNIEKPLSMINDLENNNHSFNDDNNSTIVNGLDFSFHKISSDVKDIFTEKQEIYNNSFYTIESPKNIHDKNLVKQHKSFEEDSKTISTIMKTKTKIKKNKNRSSLDNKQKSLEETLEKTMTE